MRAGPSVTIVRTACFVAEPGAGFERVAHVQLEGILLARYARDAALRPGGVGLRAFAFGDDRDRPVPGRLQGKGQSGDAAADDDEIVFLHGSLDIVDQPSLAEEYRECEKRVRLDRDSRLQIFRIDQFDIINPRQRARSQYAPARFR